MPPRDNFKARCTSTASQDKEGEVIASSLDELAPQHVGVAEMRLARARRCVEMGQDAIAIVRKMASSGFSRRRMPKELMVLQLMV